jgi:LPXTG-motif cell wall-anchored protein
VSPEPGTTGDRVDLSDIRAKLTEIDTEVRGATEIDRPDARTTTLVVVGAAVVLIAAAFLLGRRRGRRTSTWVEIRRL